MESLYSDFALIGTPDSEKEEEFYETEYPTCLECGEKVERIDLQYCDKCIKEME